MTKFREKLIRFLETRQNYSVPRERNAAYDLILSSDDRSENDRSIIWTVETNYLPYFRGWLAETDLQIKYREAMYDLMLEMLKSEKPIQLEQAKAFTPYKAAQDKIGQDMEADPAKYATTSGDIEW